MDDFKHDQTDNDYKLFAVIDNFLTSQSSLVNWKTVIAAIESPTVNDKETADLIRQYLSTGKSNKLLLLSNEVINSGVQTTTVKCIQFSYNQHCSHTMYIS